jgi:hypothetical protein
VIPGAIFAFLSLRQVEEKFRQETMRRMRLQARDIVMSIHGGFSSVETEVEFLAGILGGGTNRDRRRSWDWGWMFQGRPLLGATRFREGSRSETLFGKTCPPPPQTAAAQRHLASNKGLIFLERGPGGSARFFLAHAIRGNAPDRDLLVCEVNSTSGDTSGTPLRRAPRSPCSPVTERPFS